MDANNTIVVGFPLYQNCTLVDFAGATQVFAADNGFLPIWIANEPSILTTEGVSVTPNYNFDNCPQIDILFIPGGGYDPKIGGVPKVMQDQVYLDFIRKMAKTANWYGSVCTGAFILAASGLLKDCLATTYWSQIPTLGLVEKKLNLTIPEGYPRFLLDEDKKIFTGGGISSSLDLALELVLYLKGKEVAELSQLSIQYQPSKKFQSGDPAHAPESITEKLTQLEAGFTKKMIAAAEKLL
jgi:cyclohexyl-isocyanide hydratase